MQDIVIVGGGVIGMTTAWELAGEGLKVTVLDQGEPGQEASWAGAGMIPPGDVNHPATHQLAALSAHRWPELSAALHAETGLHNEYTRCGGLLLSNPGEEAQLQHDWQSRHITAPVLTRQKLLTREPGLGEAVNTAVWLPDMAQVRNSRHLKTLKAACLARGVLFQSGQEVMSWDHSDCKVTAAVTRTDRFHAADFIITAGAWSSPLLARLGSDIPIEPMHGQIVLLRCPQPVFRHVIEHGRLYLVPRRDGRTLVGATEELIGFEKRNTEQATQELLAFAAQIVPALAQMPIEKKWSGLRPRCLWGRPVIGRLPHYSNVLVAAGHYRAGLSNSPGTGLIMKQLVFGEPPNIDLTPFGMNQNANAAV